MFLAQAMSSDRSCQSIVNQAAVQRLIGGLSLSSSHTGGYCRARQRIPLQMIHARPGLCRGRRAIGVPTAETVSTPLLTLNLSVELQEIKFLAVRVGMVHYISTVQWYLIGLPARITQDRAATSDHD